jgi:hypothetical protein
MVESGPQPDGFFQCPSSWKWLHKRVYAAGSVLPDFVPAPNFAYTFRSADSPKGPGTKLNGVTGISDTATNSRQEPGRSCTEFTGTNFTLAVIFHTTPNR